ncbi:MAG: hypothetical protein EOR57_31430 [Mesorhizobium sp.]|uniref:hypothetical protein n=1 Tax=Mesorhizobium sp. TaxID=1871066 RepID=UPI000FEA747B|nr:hypothetical protein [Mesorhizobium sp.]RWL14859.1 MAG: hypothetical protein EOR57_31430 [Mesorhizobium sp.]
MSAPYDRPAADPGGMECMDCGVIFVGSAAHDQCAVCANNGWMPIETAPNDGSEFLVWFPTQREIGYGFHVQAAYGYPAAFRFFWFDVEEGADLNEPDERPAHWQPLPKPPVQS